MEAQLGPMLSRNVTRYKKVNSEIITFAEGVALDFIYTSLRGDTKLIQKQLFVISNNKAFTITCTAKKSVFSECYRSDFEPILSSINIR